MRASRRLTGTRSRGSKRAGRPSLQPEVEYNDKNHLFGLLGHREYDIFGDNKPFIHDLGSIVKDDEWSLEEDEGLGKEETDFKVDESFERRVRETYEDREYDNAKQRLSRTLLREHEVFMQGKRSTFIESQPFAHEPADRKPKFSLPFSPVKNSTYDITSVEDGEDGELISVNSDNLPGLDDSPHPGTRHLDDGKQTEEDADAILDSKIDKVLTPLQRRASRLPSDVRQLRKSIVRHKKGEEAEKRDKTDSAVRSRRETELTSHSVISKIHTEDSKGHDFFTSKEKETYFGHRARKDFFYKYREVARRAETIPDRNLLTSHGRSPRSEYLAEINRKGLLPWPVLLRCTTAPKVVDLSGMGLGDDVIKSFTSILEKLPQVDTLLLSDNRLTDDSLKDLCETVTHIHSLTHLDISFNDMDESSKTILEYLKNPNCNLKVLIMEHSDIDDFECGDLMDALKVNKSLQSLDLKDNLLGEKEQLNVVFPDFDTGGEVIGRMIAINTTLTELDISWNSIRGDSAMELAECLGENNVLKRLILSHNAFGDVPSQMLGDVLTRNTSLTHLDLSYNAVSPAAAMVIANSFKKNTTLDKVELNGNTIGRRGAEALMQALRRSKRENGHLLIQINNCDCEYEDVSLFDPVEPAGTYNLKMEQPYARMVVSELLRMANERPGAYFKSVKYSKGLKFDHGWQPIELQQGDGEGGGKSRQDSSQMQEAWKVPMKKIIDELSDGVIDEPDNCNRDIRELLSMMGLQPSIDTVDKIMWSLDLSNIKEETMFDTIFRSIFHIVDADESQCVDFNEMRIAMSLLAIRVSDDEVKRIIAEFDIDKSGEIEEDEFVSWMINTYAKQKEVSKPPVRYKGSPWNPPDSGTLVIEFKADRMPPSLNEIGSDMGISRLLFNIQNAESEAERAKLFDKATANSDIYMTAAQAQELMTVCRKGEEVDTIEKLLPQMSDPQQVSSSDSRI